MTMTALPPAPDRGDPTTFADRGDALMAALPGFIAEANALEANVVAKEASAVAAAATAIPAAATAVASAQSAMAAAQSAVSAPGTSASSSNSLVIEKGGKSLTIQTGKALVVGATVKIAATSHPTQWMAGDVTAYDPSTGALAVNVLLINGAGTFAAWTVSLSGPLGASMPWASVVNTPTTLAGYGIADALDSASTHRLYMAMAASLSLPNITGLPGVGVMAPSNATVVPASLTTSDGWSVATGFVAGTLSVIASAVQATAHGLWLGRTMTPPTLGSFSGLGTAGQFVASCQLSANVVVILYKGSGNTTNAVALNPATGAFGAPVQLSNNTPVATNVALYADTSTTFVAFYGSGKACAGSVDTGTLAITPGTEVGVDNTTYTPKQLTSGVYLSPGNGSSPRPIAVNGTTITPGSSVSLGTNTGGARVARISPNTALVVYTSTGGGSNSTRALSAVIATITGGVLTYGTASTQASNNNNDGAIRLLQPFVDGGSWLVCVQNGTTGTSGNYSAIMVSGSTVTIGAQTVRTSDLVATTWASSNSIYKSATPVIRYDASTILLGHLSSGPYAVTISGTTLTFGAAGGPATVVNFLTDFAGTGCYAVGAAAVNKLSVSGTTITSLWALAVAPTAVSSDMLNDKAVKYSGNWYAWTLPTVATLITADRWLLNTASNTTILGGPVA